MTYTVEVTREDDAWIADVVDLPGAHTYARNLTALDDAVHEVIALVADLPDDADRPPVRYVYQGVDDTFLDAARLGEERAELEAATAAATYQAAVTAAKLARVGYSMRDIAGVLQMSPGRVSQIIGAGAPAPEARETRPSMIRVRPGVWMTTLAAHAIQDVVVETGSATSSDLRTAILAMGDFGGNQLNPLFTDADDDIDTGDEATTLHTSHAS